MTPTLALPETPTERVPTSVGLPLAPGTSADQELRRTVPATITSALDSIWQQTQAEVLEPLLYTPDGDELVKTFQSVYPTYWRHHVSASLLILGGVGGDLRRLFVVTTRALEFTDLVLQDRAAAWIGEDAANASLLALRTIRRAARGMAIGLGTRLPAPGEQRDDAWRTNFVAYAMVTSAILYAIADGRHRGRMENARTLAYWSRGYAMQAYHSAKVLGLIRPAPATGAFVGGHDEQGVLLAEMGVNDYREMLDTEDPGASSPTG